LIIGRQLAGRASGPVKKEAGEIMI